MHWLGRHRRIILALIAAFSTGVVLLAHFFPQAPFLSGIWSAEHSFADLLRREGRRTTTHKDFVFLGIDQQSLSMDSVEPDEIANSRALQLMAERQPPWSRELWVLLMDKLFASGVRVIIFDMVFSPPSDADAQFRAALEKYRDRVVIGSNIDYKVLKQHVVPNKTLIPAPQTQDDRVGFVNFWPDFDGIVRHSTFHVSERQLADLPEFPGEEIFTSLAGRALGKLGRADALPGDLKGYAIRFGSTQAYSPRPLYEVFLPASWHSNYGDGAFFKDKIVLVGPSAQIIHDFVDTPIDPNLYGAAMHLHALAAALDHEFLYETPIRVDFILVLLGGLSAWVLVAFLRRPFLCLVTLLGISGAYLGLARI